MKRRWLWNELVTCVATVLTEVGDLWHDAAKQVEFARVEEVSR